MLKRELAHFTLAGLAGYAADAGVLLLTNPLIGPYFGRLASFVAAVFVTWIINRSLTFRNRRKYSSLYQEFAAYFITALAGGCASIGLYSLLIFNFKVSNLGLMAFVAAGSLAGMAINFLLSKHVVFKPHA